MDEIKDKDISEGIEIKAGLPEILRAIDGKPGFVIGRIIARKGKYDRYFTMELNPEVEPDVLERGFSEMGLQVKLTLRQFDEEKARGK